MKSNLEILREARELLGRTYIKWTLDDGSGGHCAVGCLCSAAGNLQCSDVALTMTNASARRMHPELSGAEAERYNVLFGMTMPCLYPDIFNEHPTVYVNNHLGKEAILAVFDDAILHEEMREMLAKLEVEETAGDVPVERETVTVQA